MPHNVASWEKGKAGEYPNQDHITERRPPLLLLMRCTSRAHAVPISHPGAMHQGLEAKSPRLLRARLPPRPPDQEIDWIRQVCFPAAQSPTGTLDPAFPGGTDSRITAMFLGPASPAGFWPFPRSMRGGPRFGLLPTTWLFPRPTAPAVPEAMAAAHPSPTQAAPAVVTARVGRCGPWRWLVPNTRLFPKPRTSAIQVAALQ